MRSSTSGARLGRRSRRLISAVVASIPVLGVAQFASAQNTTWTFNGNGNWNAAGVWSPVEPTASTHNVFIDDDDSDVNVTLNTNRTIGDLTVGSGDTLTFSNSNDLRIDGDVTNNGLILMNDAGSVTDLVVGSAGLTLSGSGILRLNGSANNRIFGSLNTNILENTSTHRVEGGGQLGAAALGIRNAGIIEANLSGSALTLSTGVAADVDGLGSDGQNTGSILASNGGIIQFNSGVWNNVGGLIQAGTASFVRIANSTHIKGGQLSTSGTGLIQINGLARLESLELTLGSTLQINNSEDPVLVGTITNNGTVQQNDAGSVTDVRLSGSVTLAGSGVWQMSNSTNNRWFTETGASQTLINGTFHTLAGAGQVGTNDMGLINRGLIVANHASNNRLTIDPANVDVDGLGADVRNLGTLRGSNDGFLRLQGGVFNNTGGLIEAITAGEVEFAGGAHIIGGTLTTDADPNSFIRIVGNTVTLENITNNGRLVIDNGVDPVLVGTITNNATVDQNDAGSVTDTEISGPVTLAGTGVWRMTNSPNNRWFTQGAGTAQVLTNSASHTISGAGNLGDDDMGLINNGLIEATHPSALTINPHTAVDAGGGANVINNGLLRAAGGILALDSGTFLNNGSILAQNASTVNFNTNARIIGGSLITAGSGILQTNGSPIFQNVTLTTGSLLRINNGHDPTLVGTITNNGTIEQNDAGNLTDTEISGPVTLAGTGIWQMSNSTNNRWFTAGSGSAQVLTNAVGHTLAGSGQLGTDDMGLINNGLIVSNIASGNRLTIDPADVDVDGTGSDVRNTSTLRARNDSLMRLQGGVFNNAGGLIEAIEAAEVELHSGAHIIGGTLSTDADSNSLIRVTGPATIQDLTIAGQFVINNSEDPTLIGTITNNGSVLQNDAGSVTDVQINGNVLINGSGVWNISNSTNNRWYTAGSGAAMTLTNGPAHTIQGGGQLGTDDMGLVNQGIVSANQPSTLTIDPANLDQDGQGTDVLNDTTGTLRGSGSGGLQLTGGSFRNLGTVEALNGSNVTYSSSAVTTNNVSGVLTGGTWRSVATGSGAVLTIRGSSITQIAGSTTVELSGAGSVFQVVGTSLESTLATNNGALKVLNNRNYTNVNAFANGATPADTAILQLGGGSFNAPSLVNQTNSTITGFGTIVPRPTNHGLIQSAGGALVFNNGIQGGSGTVHVLSGSHIDLSGGAMNSSGDYLLIDSTGSLSLGSNNFLVSVDYVNANAGTGNSFNPRANVNGTGQIQASPAVSQSLTGNVTNGTGPTPNMDFGNIRVGSVSIQSYQINNVGATGPVLRGAIQTNNTGGNNGNITDPRLTGTGVTAGDFGPISNNGSISESVTFTGLSAGALASQAVAVVNNFDNVGEQLLSITGAVYNPAVPSVAPGSLQFGNFHVGDVIPSQAITISNFAPAGAFSEDLRVENITPTGAAQLTGPNAVNVTAGSGTTAISASMSTATAGNKSGSIAMDLLSNATVNGVAIPGLSSLSLGSATVNISGTVYRLATAFTPTPLNLGQFHVGSLAQGSIVVSNTGASDGFTENLHAIVSGFSGDVAAGTGSAAIGGGTNSGAALLAQLSTATAGNKSGNVTINLTSLAGGTGLSNTNLGSASVQVNGTAFNLAQLQINNPSIDFGIVHVGDAVPNVALSITNTAGAGSFSENLNSSFGPANVGIVHNGGSINLLAAQGSNNTNMTVGISTASKQVINGTVPVNAQSDGTGINSLGQTNLPSQNVTIVGQVNDYADPIISKLLGSGVFSSTGTDTYLLDFGTVIVGDIISADLQLLNDVINPADSLGGSWLTSGSAYFFNGFNTFNSLAPGGTIGSLDVTLNTGSPGTFTGSITLTPRSQNSSGYNQPLGGTVVVNISGTVEVPEPVTVLPLLVASILQRRRRRA